MNDIETFRAASGPHTQQDIKLFYKAIAAAKKHFTKEWTGVLMHFAVGGEKDTWCPFASG